jgi:hypothetical protein
MLQVQCHPVDFNKIWLRNVLLKDRKPNFIFVRILLVHKSPCNFISSGIKKLTGYTMSATRPAQLILVVIPRMKPKLNVFNKMLGAESADDTKHGVWPVRVKDGTAVSRNEQTPR